MRCLACILLVSNVFVSTTRAQYMGFVAAASEDCGGYPPDMSIATSAQVSVVAWNGGVGVFDLAGQEISQTCNFFSGLGPGYDPYVVFDEFTERFFLSAFAKAPLDKVLIAVSSDDTGAIWHRVEVTTTETFFDRPRLAVCSEAVLVMDSDGVLLVVDKASLLAGGDIVAESHQLSQFTYSAAIVDSPLGGATAYMLEHVPGNNRTWIKLGHVAAPIGGALQVDTIDVSVPSYSGCPAYVPHGSDGGALDLTDGGPIEVTRIGDVLWATDTIALQYGGKALVRWYQIKLNGWPEAGTPELVQSGDIDAGTDYHACFGAIVGDDNGGACVVFNRSKAGEPVAVCSSYRLLADSHGTLRPIVVQKLGTDSYGGSGVSRWGDYSSATKQAGTGRYWGVGEYSDSDTWRLWAVGIVPEYLLGDLNCDGIVNGFDIDPFLEALYDPAQYAADYPDCYRANADIDEDGTVSSFDIDDFLELIS
ncbi:MAG: hypothetical protein CHACPFDD_03743 [Phycisphaerae bacterium]|nr:hypothetical protein [Phycisphaerae bacterium]